MLRADPPVPENSTTAAEGDVASERYLDKEEQAQNSQQETDSPERRPEHARQEPVTENTAVADSDRMDLTDGEEHAPAGEGASTQEDATGVTADTNAVIPTVGNAADTPSLIPGLHSTATDAILTSDTLAPEAGTDGAEWEIDSSPYDSSSDSDDSSDTDSSDDDSEEDADGDYAMLDPEEAARILMHGDGGSDDEGGASRNKSDGAALRTLNEGVEEVIPKPEVVIT